MTSHPIQLWPESSISYGRGLAATSPGNSKTHALTEKDQGVFHYVLGPYVNPVLTVKPGDTILIETQDCYGGVIKTEEDRPSEKVSYPRVNPQSGPIAVTGAEKGDCLAIHIISVNTRGEQPAGTTCLVPEFGGLVGTDITALLNDPLPDLVKKLHISEEGVHWNDDLVLPYEPFIGTIGVSPEIEAISSLQPDYHGGNMDMPDVAPGAILYLPVHTAGGLLYVGDCHARQGDGEISGVAVEQAATVKLTIDLIKNWSFAWPRLETENFIMTIGSARPLEDAVRIAYRELVKWMTFDFGFEELDAYMLLGQIGHVRLGNMVDPKYTVGAWVEKKYLIPKKPR
ncbi:MAG: acetamidase/formamidase family protein [Rhizobiaceae bacterium]